MPSDRGCEDHGWTRKLAASGGNVITWPRYEFDDADVSAAHEPASIYYFAADVDGITTHPTMLGARSRRQPTHPFFYSQHNVRILYTRKASPPILNAAMTTTRGDSRIAPISTVPVLISWQRRALRERSRCLGS